MPPTQMYWRTLGGGHLLSVETCPAGVTWGLGYDGKPWVYTGGWGGAHFKGVASSKFGINQVHNNSMSLDSILDFALLFFQLEDTKYFYVYENQRWNPLTGFTDKGLLPTDRYESRKSCCTESQD